MSSNLKTSEVLDLAADAIQMAGWGRGVDSWAGFDNAGLCIEGAIMAVLGLENCDAVDDCPAYAAASEYLGEAVPERFGRRQLWAWNDNVPSSGEEVIETLRAAAAVERVKEATASATYDTADQPLPVDIPETSAA